MTKLAIVYWTGTGNTEAMSDAIADGFRESSDSVDIYFSDDFKSSMLDNYEIIAFGCPAMGDEVLEEASFEPMFTECEPHLEGKKICIFGSYEWNNGEWMDDWEERCKKSGAIFAYPPLIAYDYPDSQAIEKCKELGRACAQA